MTWCMCSLCRDLLAIPTHNTMIQTRDEDHATLKGMWIDWRSIYANFYLVFVPSALLLLVWASTGLNLKCLVHNCPVMWCKKYITQEVLNKLWSGISPGKVPAVMVLSKRKSLTKRWTCHAYMHMYTWCKPQHGSHIHCCTRPTSPKTNTGSSLTAGEVPCVHVLHVTGEAGQQELSHGHGNVHVHMCWGLPLWSACVQPVVKAGNRSANS